MEKIEKFQEIRKKIDKKHEELLEKLKNNTESTDTNDSVINKIKKEIDQQSQWINDLNQAYKEAETEILDRIKQLSECPEFEAFVKHTMQQIARVNKDKALEYGVGQIQEFLKYYEYYSAKQE